MARLITKILGGCPPSNDHPEVTEQPRGLVQGAFLMKRSDSAVGATGQDKAHPRLGITTLSTNQQNLGSLTRGRSRRREPSHLALRVRLPNKRGENLLMILQGVLRRSDRRRSFDFLSRFGAGLLKPRLSFSLLRRLPTGRQCLVDQLVKFRCGNYAVTVI